MPPGNITAGSSGLSFAWKAICSNQFMPPRYATVGGLEPVIHTDAGDIQIVMVAQEVGPRRIGTKVDRSEAGDIEIRSGEMHEEILGPERPILIDRVFRTAADRPPGLVFCQPESLGVGRRTDSVKVVVTDPAVGEATRRVEQRGAGCHADASACGAEPVIARRKPVGTFAGIDTGKPGQTLCRQLVDVTFDADDEVADLPVVARLQTKFGALGGG